MAARWAEALLKLQRVDLKIRELEARLALLPKEMTELKNKRDAAVAEVNAAASAAKKIELERKGVESEIEKLNAENKRLQQQSAMVKKNTEYQAMLGTIALNEKKVGDLESRELELMDRFEEARKAYRKIRQDNEAAVNAIRAEFDELVAFAGDLKKEIAQLKEERPADIRGVDGETLARYNRLLRQLPSPGHPAGADQHAEGGRDQLRELHAFHLPRRCGVTGDFRWISCPENFRTISPNSSTAASNPTCWTTRRRSAGRK